jgi:hypothetical protein
VNFFASLKPILQDREGATTKPLAEFGFHWRSGGRSKAGDQACSADLGRKHEGSSIETERACQG